MYKGEKFNSFTHLLGTVFALMGFGALLAIGWMLNDGVILLSFSLFGLTLVLLYSASSLYHSIQSPKLKSVFQVVDHIAIYLLIAGTYTPFMLVSLGEGNGPRMLSWIWGLALLGGILELIKPPGLKVVQVAIYLGMGWLCTLEFDALKLALSDQGMTWMFAGGVAYTAGVVFYVLDKLKRLTHAHGIWHLFVLMGSFCHFVCIALYVR